MSHAVLSPSAFSRVIACPASFIANLHLKSESSAASNRGSDLHALAETILRAIEQAILDGSPYRVIDVTDETAEIIEYVNYCSSLMERAKFSSIEHRVDLSSITDKVSAFGTVDFVSYTETAGGVLEIVDLKTGNMLVSPKNNVQLSLYAIGALDYLLSILPDLPIREIVLTIHQGGEPKSESLTLLELVERQAAYRDAFIKATSPAPAYNAGKHCQFCSFKPQCPKQVEIVRAALMGNDGTLNLLPVDEPTSVGELVELFHLKPTINSFLESVESYLESKLIAGAEIGGVMLKSTAARAKWKNEQQVVDYIFESYPDDAKLFVKPVTITEMRKLLGVKTVDEMTERGDPTQKIKADIWRT